MGLTKQYLRYVQSAVFNVVGSTWSNFVVVDKPGKKGPICAVGACENVVLWDLRLGDKHSVVKNDEPEQTTVITKSPDNSRLAVGYKSGNIRIFDLKTGELVATFSGHVKPVSCLSYDRDGMRLASGGQDSAVILWDVVDEVGLFRLNGHAGEITQARFLGRRNVLITSCKDKLIKFWDLDAKHCFKTLTQQSSGKDDSEVYDFILSRDESLLITGSLFISLWKLSFTDNNDYQPQAKVMKIDEQVSDTDMLEAVYIGTMEKHGKGRILSMCQDRSGMYFGCHGTHAELEIYKIYTAEESKKHLKKRTKKMRMERDSDELDQKAPEEEISDKFRCVGRFKVDHPMKTFCITSVHENMIASVVVMFRNNTFGQYELELSKKIEKTKVEGKLMSRHGHQKEPVTVTFSSDNMTVLSASAESLKVWNRESQQCFRTLSCIGGTCSAFILADTVAVIGTKGGSLEVFNIPAAELAQSVPAHEGGVNAVCVAGKSLLVSGGSDKHVAFWEVDLKVGPEMMKMTKRVKVADEVLCLSYSADRKYLAIGCLDRKAYVFYADTMNILHTLFSHQQPVSCISISSDSARIATGSGDKDIKVWSMEFGECLRIIKVAHEDRVTGLQFVPNTHMAFSCGRDGKVTQWDLDSFERTITLRGHQDGVNSISVSPNGKTVVTASSDMSMRFWSKTDEIIIPDEERQMEEEKREEDGMRGRFQVPGEACVEVGVAGLKTSQTLSAVERLCDALDLYKDEKEKLEEYRLKCKVADRELPEPEVNILFQGLNVKTPERYVLEILKGIKSNDRKECLLVLPFSYVMQLVPLLDELATTTHEVELITHTLCALLRIHAGQIASNRLFQDVLENFQKNTVKPLRDLKDVLGYNLAALKLFKQKMEKNETDEVFKDKSKRRNKKKPTKDILVINS